ncbi:MULTISPECIES: hypothetical protein [unclassified Bradyrhizobium]|nr:MULTISPECIES: hypothetical protein [unclassified Bradyrhizobium]
MTIRPDAGEVAGLAGLLLLISVLLPVISRAHFVFACFDLATRGMH